MVNFTLAGLQDELNRVGGKLAPKAQVAATVVRNMAAAGVQEAREALSEVRADTAEALRELREELRLFGEELVEEFGPKPDEEPELDAFAERAATTASAFEGESVTLPYKGVNIEVKKGQTNEEIKTTWRNARQPEQANA
jgi:hypothetical protein